VFGALNWDRETVYCKEVCQYTKKSKNDKELFVVGYEAQVRITVRFEADGVEKFVTKTGTGHGSGEQTSLFSSIESAAKEAETDAMKRAMMMFGSQFGLALYDKSKEMVDWSLNFHDGALLPPEPTGEEKIERHHNAMIDADNYSTLAFAWAGLFGLVKNDAAKLEKFRGIYNARKSSFSNEEIAEFEAKRKEKQNG
jgi:hypothetical protein